MDKLTVTETMTEGGCLCPECGWTGGATPPTRLWHWTRLGPILLTGGAFIGFVVWLWMTGATSRVSSGGTYPRFVDAGFSQAQVEAIASAEQADGDFARMVLEAAHATMFWRDVKEHGVEVAYLKPDGQRSSSRSRGWPIPWMWIGTYDTYDDILAKTGRKVSVTDPKAAPAGRWAMASDPLLVPVQPLFEWHSFIVTYRPPPEKTGGSYVQGSIFPLLFLSLPCAMCLVLWYVLLVAARLGSLLGTKMGRLRSGKARLVTVCVLGIVFFAFNSLYVKTNTSPPYSRSYTSQQAGKSGGFRYSQRKEFRRLSVTLDEFEAIVAGPNADENVAKLIAEALEGIQFSVDKRLAIAADPEALMHDAEYLFRHPQFPVVAIMQSYFMRRSDFGPEALVEPIAGLRVNHQGKMIRFMWSSGAAEDGTRSVSVRIDLLAMVVVAAWFLWWLPHMLLCGFPRMRTFKRRLSGQCIRCAYPVVRQTKTNVHETNTGL